MYHTCQHYLFEKVMKLISDKGTTLALPNLKYAHMSKCRVMQILISLWVPQPKQVVKEN